MPSKILQAFAERSDAGLSLRILLGQVHENACPS
jgi:hypothetical protein